MQLPPERFDQFLHRLCSAASQMRSIACEDALRAYGLGMRDWLLLEGLAKLGTTTQRDLTGPTKLDKVAVNRAVSRLRECDCITTRPNTRDGRSHLIELSAKGLEIHTAASAAIDVVEQKILACFTSEEIFQIYGLIDKIENVLSGIESPLELKANKYNFHRNSFSDLLKNAA